MRQKKKKPTSVRGLRKIVIGKAVWHYKVGRGATVLVDPDGAKTVVSHADMLGMSWHTIERAHWKCVPTANITPKHIQEWLTK